MVLSSSPVVTTAAFEAGTGWSFKPEGACKDVRCVPLPPGAVSPDGVDLRIVADRLRMPLLEDDASGFWALGPEAGGRALTTATAPDLVLPDLDGRAVALSSYRGTKVLIAAWASW